MNYDAEYCYPDTEVLKNKLDIHDADILERVARNISVYQISVLYKTPLKGQYDFEYYKKIHKFIFDKVYDWAGQTRHVDMCKEGGNAFCHSMYIDGMANDIFADIRNNNFFRNMEKPDIVPKLAELFGDLNALHPFREGNGRTERVFLVSLLYDAGWTLDFSKVDRETYLKASTESMLCATETAEKMFSVCLSKTVTERIYTSSETENLMNKKKSGDRQEER